MRVPKWLLVRMLKLAARVQRSRPPDFIIGEAERPYMLRWWVIPRNALFNIYLHEVRRSDDDRALHDHPWINCSIVLAGQYREHSIAAGGIEAKALREAGSLVFRRAKAAHRLEVEPGKACLTLFITGPRVRQWGFHCPQAGWRHWRDFTGVAIAGDEDPRAKGLIGRGCE